MSWTDINDAEVVNQKVSFDIDNLGVYAIKKQPDNSILYDNGVQNVELVGDNATFYMSPTYKFNDTNIYIYNRNSGHTGQAWVYTKNKVDVSNYRYVCADIMRTETTCGTAITIWVNTPNRGYYNSENRFADVFSEKITTRQTFKMDLNNYDLTPYDNKIFIGVRGDDTHYVYKIWLE